MSWLKIALLSVAGLAFHAAWYGPALESATAHGRNDFLNFYTAGKLAGTPDLYRPAKFIAAEAVATGYSTENLIFVRLPWQAALLWPLARMPYFTAYCAWQSLGLMALVAAVLLFPVGSLQTKVLACAWSFPLFTSFAVAQDVPFVLLAIACAFRFDGKHDAVSGACMALCAAKVHLLWLFVVVFLQWRNRKQIAAFFGCGAVLGSLCFIAGGASWVPAMLGALRFCEGHEQLGIMPNLHMLFQTAPQAELVGTLVIIALVFLIRRRDRVIAGAAALAGGLLIGRHCFLADCSILLPAVGVVTACLPEFRHWVLLLLAPFIYLPAFLGQPLLTTLFFIAFVLGTLFALHRFATLVLWPQSLMGTPFATRSNSNASRE